MLLTTPYVAETENNENDVILHFPVAPSRQQSNMKIISLPLLTACAHAFFTKKACCWNVRAESFATTPVSVSRTTKPSPTSNSMTLIRRVSRGGGASLVSPLQNSYARLLETYPIRTKSVTAGIIFVLSDYLAQAFTKSSESTSSSSSLDVTRLLVSGGIGLCYFGPAAHYWYEWMFTLWPGTSLMSTVKKAALGQVFFGPTFTAIFFASSLLQSGTFTLSNFVGKLKSDFPSTWLAGVGFWPLVDLVSYSFVAPQWIPLFVNVCSLVWTTYLVIRSYQ